MENTDHFKQKILLWGIFLMSCVDAVLTLMWIKLSVGEEINPILEKCLEWGPSYFILGKISLTIIGCLVLFACRRSPKAMIASGGLFIFYSAIILYPAPFR